MLESMECRLRFSDFTDLLFNPPALGTEREPSVPAESHLVTMSSQSEIAEGVPMSGCRGSRGADSAVLIWVGITLTEIGHEG